MNFSVTNIETLFEESNALFECYVERVFESESVTDLISASHWYTDAIFNLMTFPPQR